MKVKPFNAVIFSLFAAAAFAGCNVVDTAFYRSYITEYGFTEKFSVWERYDDDVYYISADFTWCSMGDKEGTPERDTYEALCLKHGDMSYNSTVGGINDFRPAVGYDFVSLDITSASDYSEGYPAGTSLAPLTEFAGLSVEPYVSGGYREFYKGEYPTFYYFSDWEREVYPVTGSLDELGPEDMRMLVISGNWSIECIGSLRFVSRPTLSRSHDFTLTLTTDEGRVFEAAFHVDFD